MESVNTPATHETKLRMAQAIVDAVLAVDPSAMAAIERSQPMVSLDCYVDPEDLLISLQMRKPIEIEIKTTEQQDRLIELAVEAALKPIRDAYRAARDEDDDSSMERLFDRLGEIL